MSKIEDSLVPPTPAYSREEEMVSAASHGIGFLAVLAVSPFLILLAFENSTTWGQAGTIFYVFSLLFSFGTSTVYHAATSTWSKMVMKKMDHIAIYFLISGSYTALITNRMMNEDGYPFLIALWGMSFVGIWFKAVYVHRFKVFSTLIYIFMGYILMFDPYAFFDALEYWPKRLFLIGGIFYTVGAGFYLAKKMRWSHPIWHFFTLIAAACHFAAFLIELS